MAGEAQVVAQGLLVLLLLAQVRQRGMQY